MRTCRCVCKLDMGSPWAAIVTSLMLSLPCAAAGPTLDWIRQLGTWGGDSDGVGGISPDGLGSVYLSANLLDGSSPYPTDGLLNKYGPAGNLLWSQQFDGPTGSVVVCETGDIMLSASPGAAGPTFITFDAAGNELSIGPARPPGSLAFGTGGSVYSVQTVGRPLPDDDGLLTKFDATGNELWSRQFGTDYHEQSHIVSADSAGNIFVYGTTIESDRSYVPIATLTKFDAEGNEHWTRYVESARYVNRGGVIGDGLGNVYITGNSNAPIYKPRVHLGYDAFLAKYDAEGNQLWLQEFGTAEFADKAGGVALDGLGNVFVTGTMGDPFLARFDTDGNRLWTYQFGTPEAETASHVVADRLGNIFIAGLTRGDLGGPNAGVGGYDVYLAKFRVAVPEPSTAFLLLIAATLAVLRPRP